MPLFTLHAFVQLVLFGTEPVSFFLFSQIITQEFEVWFPGRYYHRHFVQYPPLFVLYLGTIGSVTTPPSKFSFFSQMVIAQFNHVHVISTHPYHRHYIQWYKNGHTHWYNTWYCRSE